MKLKFVNADSLDRNLKATVHKNGKLGFTAEGAQKMGLDIKKSVRIALNEEDLTDKNLYIFVIDDVQPGSFKIRKAGEYYYLNTRPLFDNLKIDYEKEAVSFDILLDTHEGQTYFKLKRRNKTTKRTTPINMEADH